MRQLSLLLVLLAAGCGGSSGELGGPDLSEAEAMTLRLSDLPPGFRYGDDRGCGVIVRTPGENRTVNEFLVETRPRGCIGEFAREWGGEPTELTAALLLFDAEADARRAWKLRRALFEEFAAFSMTSERGHGDAVAFDSEGEFQRGAGEAWRDGRLVVGLYEEGLAGDPGREFAARLAGRQRHRIESPSDPVEEEDSEIGLEDPAIPIPVYWLGRRFAPEGLPALDLIRGERVARGELEVQIEYEGGVTLELWRSRGAPHGSVVRRDGVDVAVKVSGGEYDSREGLAAIVRGLRRR